MSSLIARTLVALALSVTNPEIQFLNFVLPVAIERHPDKSGYIKLCTTPNHNSEAFRNYVTSLCLQTKPIPITSLGIYGEADMVQN